MNVAPSLNEEADITQVPENAAFTLGPHASMTVSRFDWQTGGRWPTMWRLNCRCSQ